MFYDRFVELCKEKQVRPTTACVEMGLSRGLASKWKAVGTERPAAEVLEKMSVYFELSIDEILGIEKEPAAVSDRLSEEEIQFIKWYRNQASEKDKAIVRMIVEGDSKK